MHIFHHFLILLYLDLYAHTYTQTSTHTHTPTHTHTYPHTHTHTHKHTRTHTYTHMFFLHVLLLTRLTACQHCVLCVFGVYCVLCVLGVHRPAEAYRGDDMLAVGRPLRINLDLLSYSARLAMQQGNTELGVWGGGWWWGGCSRALLQASACVYLCVCTYVVVFVCG